MKSKLSIAAMWLLAFVPLVLVAALYRLLPDQVPMHWGFDGVVNRYGSKNELWFLAALGPVFALLFQFLPRLDPKKRSYERFQKYYEAFAVVMTAFIAVIMGIALVESFRPGTLSVGRAVSILLGLLFVFLGNMMGKSSPTTSSACAPPGPWPTPMCGTGPTGWRDGSSSWRGWSPSSPPCCCRRPLCSRC